MSGKHTKGEMSYEDKRPQCGGFSLFAGDQFIGFVSDSDECTDWQANAERLVACWNACQGIDTAYLKSGSDCNIQWPRQGSHRAVQLVEAPKIHCPMAEPVAWMWRVADSDWQLESTCPPERPLAIVEPLYTGYMADAYIGAMEEVEIWKRRALEAEKKLQAESTVSAKLLSELNAERARSGLAHRKAVQEAVREALHEAKKACENLPAPEACSGVERSLWDVATMACAEAVGNVGTP